jgi:hypothetical protein
MSKMEEVADAVKEFIERYDAKHEVLTKENEAMKAENNSLRERVEII